LEEGPFLLAKLQDEYPFVKIERPVLMEMTKGENFDN